MSKYGHNIPVGTTVSFCRVAEEWGGLSNMSKAFPLHFNKRYVRTVEAIYQALKFPDYPDIQERIIIQASPMVAKNVSRSNEPSVREDWHDIKVDVMQWCLREKLVQNSDTFGPYLLGTKGKIIVERSYRDFFWGAGQVSEKFWKGENRLGYLLTDLRDAYDKDPETAKKSYDPEISNFTFLGEKLRWTGSDDE